MSFMCISVLLVEMLTYALELRQGLLSFASCVVIALVVLSVLLSSLSLL